MDDMQTVGNGDNANNADTPNSASPNGTSEQPANLDEQMWTDKGNAAAQAGDYETAAEAFEQAVEADPTNARARYNLALTLNPDNALAPDNLRDVRERVNTQLRRVMEQEKRVDEDPGDASRYAELASLYLDMRRYDDALSTANQMVAIDPEDRIAYDT